MGPCGTGGSLFAVDTNGAEALNNVVEVSEGRGLGAVAAVCYRLATIEDGVETFSCAPLRLEQGDCIWVLLERDNSDSALPLARYLWADKLHSPYCAKSQDVTSTARPRLRNTPRPHYLRVSAGP